MEDKEDRFSDCRGCGMLGLGRELGTLVPPDVLRVVRHLAGLALRQARFPVLALPLHRDAFLERHLRCGG
jgi:hypothetical protein